MSAKPRKSLTLWHSCQRCSLIVSAKEASKHNCSTAEETSFIRNGVLYSFLENLDEKSYPQHVSHESARNLLLMSQSAMQLCDFVLGFPVLVTVGDRTTVRNAWPTSEGSLTSVKLVKNELESEWGCNLPCSKVTVSKLPTQPYLVSTVSYKIAPYEKVYSESDQIERWLRHKLKDRHMYSGMRIKVPFYGRYAQVEILRGKRVDLIDLSDAVSNLELKEQFFMAIDSTEWVSLDAQDGKDAQTEIIGCKIGGYSDILLELENNLQYSLFQNANKENSFYGVLLHGVHGVGKTSVVEYLASGSKAFVVNIQGMELFSKFYGETESRLRNAFSLAVKNAPSIIILDNVESLCPKKGSDQERRTVATLLSLLDSLKNKNIAVLATATRLEDIDPSLRRPQRLEIELEVPVPTESDRLAILNVLVEDNGRLGSCLEKIARESHGFVAADLTSVVSKAAYKSAVGKRERISEDDLMWAKAQVKPSAMREVLVHIPNVKWSDVGGQDDLKLKLQQAVEWPLKYPDSFKRLGISAPKGVLLYGPPGCSKTLIAKALATESQLNFLSVKGSDIFSKWVGESERAVQKLFRRARSVAPCIIFLDEIDALGGEREMGGANSSSGGGAVQERVLSQLLTEMDGVQPLDSVIIVAATNRPDKIDRALMRPGRLDRLIYVPLPNSETRGKILDLQFAKMPVDDSVNLKVLVEKTEGYSGAEVVAVCNEAALKALEQNLEASCVTMKDLMIALDLVTPRTPGYLIDLYTNFK